MGGGIEVDGLLVMASLVLAHRGVTEAGPDNSLPAFRALSELPVDGLEFDVRVTSDDALVASHDPTIGGSRFESLTLAEIRELQGDDVDEATRIPTLAEALALIPAGLTVNLELKSPGVGPALLAAIEEMDARYELMVSSFDARPLIALKRELPRIGTGLINSVPIADPLARVRECGASALSAHWRLVTPGLVAEAGKRQIALFVWTVNEDPALREMVALGVHAIITDQPRRALEVLGR